MREAKRRSRTADGSLDSLDIGRSILRSIDDDDWAQQKVVCFCYRFTGFRTCNRCNNCLLVLGFCQISGLTLWVERFVSVC